ncbi:MAG: TIGR01777 family oxidoreductase [Ilumatobacteraceae bacterium]
MKLVIAGGTGSLGRRVADDVARRGHDVVILTRSPRSHIEHRQVVWNGRVADDWAGELEGSVLLNLAGELVIRRPTTQNIELLTRSRVEPTRALVEAASRLPAPPAVWIQMSTLAIYGDAGEDVVDEQHAPAEGPPQMAGVARAWEQSVEGARADRLVVLRTGIVLDRDTPAFDRLTKLTRFGLGGRIGTGAQWISWLHIADFLRAVRFVTERTNLDGIIHATSSNPIRNRDMMAALRSALRRPWAPPTPKPIVHVGARLMSSDPALVLTGRRCVPRRLEQAGFEFEHPTFPDAIADLLQPSVPFR